MPAAAPFTRLCQLMNAPPSVGRADLHLHTTASDGEYTPLQIVDLAKRSGLAAIAITDHDTLAGYEAIRDQEIPNLTIIPGVEISTDDDGRELHLLAYFFDPDNTELKDALDQLCHDRIERFREMIGLLRKCGVTVADDELPSSDAALGRRHLAMHLYDTGQVGSVREAFHKYLGDRGPASVPKVRLPLTDAIRLVRDAGGLTSYAHPRGDLDLTGLKRIADMGLQAVEATYPGFKRSRTDELKRWAAHLGLAITAGSDCHGPDDAKRTVGACTLSADEWAALTQNQKN